MVMVTVMMELSMAVVSAMCLVVMVMVTVMMELSMAVVSAMYSVNQFLLSCVL